MSMKDSHEDREPQIQDRRLIGLFAETDLHVGVGQVAGAVDLPVAREATTGYPVIPGSSLKGALRDRARLHASKDIEASLYGTASGDLEAQAGGSDSAGALLVGDGKLLLLPVRSLGEPFRYVTCSEVMRRFRRDLELAGASPELLPPSDREKAALVRGGGPAIVLEELAFETEADQKFIDRWADLVSRYMPGFARDSLAEILTIIDVNAFAYLCRNALPVRQRNSLDHQRKVVKDGALWSEEYVPSRALFYTLLADRYPGAGAVSRALDTLGEADRRFLQVGGKETIGLGWMSVIDPTITGAPDQ